MAEQFLRAWQLNKEDLFKVVGSADESVKSGIKSNEYIAEELNDLIEEWGDYNLDKSLDDILSGKLKKGRAYEYVRTLEGILELKGEPLEEEVTLPGRGWQDIGYLFSAWGLPTLEKLWTKGQLPFPWKKEENPNLPDWPISMILKKSDIKQLKGELESFDLSSLEKHSLPDRQEGLEEEMEFFIEIMQKWLNQDKKDLILLLDGQQ